MMGPVSDSKGADSFHEEILSAINFTASKAFKNTEKRGKTLNLPDDAAMELKGESPP